MTSISTFSQPSRFTFCIAENEEENPWRDDRLSGRWTYPVGRNNEDFFIRAINDADDLHLIVAGGNGPMSAVIPGWNGASRAVMHRY